MLIGYARVSTEDQNLDLQRDALTAAGCERIFEDKASGVRGDRQGLAEALSHLRAGDCLVIWRLDRLGRRMIALLSFVEALRQRGCDFRILNGSFPIDTATAQGRLLFHLSAALAENERDVIRERTLAGLASARSRGRKGGRPAKLTAKQVCTARKMLADPEMTIKEVAEAFGVNRATIAHLASAYTQRPRMQRKRSKLIVTYGRSVSKIGNPNSRLYKDSRDRTGVSRRFSRTSPREGWVAYGCCDRGSYIIGCGRIRFQAAEAVKRCIEAV